MAPVYETWDELRAAAWSLISTLCRERPGDMQPLPAPGQLVTVSVFRSSEDAFGKGAPPLENGAFVWDEEGPAEELDESAYRERGWDPATGQPRAGVFFQDLRLAYDGEEWHLLHAFGGSFRGRQMMNGVQHWVAFDGDHAEIIDSDLWFG